MYENYEKEKQIKELSEDEKNKELIMSVLKTEMELKVVNNNLQFAEGELIDYYIYKIKALEAKMNYLVKITKKKGLELKFRSKIG